jgi:pimeloyl-ACP methyl ester carboxylesterase
LPLLVCHGWPGSVIEQLKIIDPLTNPTAHGASASDAFHLVIPSMPGYGFSGKPTETGWGPEHIARAYAELMKRLGYDRYVAQGGVWGAEIVERMGVQAPPGLIVIHTNFAGAVRPNVSAAVQSGSPSGLDDDETRIYEKLSSFSRRTRAMQSRARPTRSRCTEFRIHPSAWPPGCSTTTRPVWR